MKTIKIILLICTILVLNSTGYSQETVSEVKTAVNVILIDPNGVKWFGTNKGLWMYDDLKTQYYTKEDYLPGDQVNDLSFEWISGEPSLWVATDEGVSHISYTEHGITNSNKYSTNDGLLENSVSAIEIDSRNCKFFGSSGGISILDDSSLTSFTFDKYPESLIDMPVRQLDIFNDTLYVAQEGGIGRLVSGVDGITGASLWDSNYGISPYSEDIKSVEVNGIYKQWFGTEKGVETHMGYFAKDGWDIFAEIDGLINNTVISINEDNEGGIWFGTYGGVSHLENNLWTSYSKKDGLVSDTVFDIDFDPDGSVWFATNAGICKLSQGMIQEVITSDRKNSVSLMRFNANYDGLMNRISLRYVTTLDSPIGVQLYDITGKLVGRWADLMHFEDIHYLDLPDDFKTKMYSISGIYIIMVSQGDYFNSQKLVIPY